MLRAARLGSRRTRRTAIRTPMLMACRPQLITRTYADKSKSEQMINDLAKQIQKKSEQLAALNVAVNPVEALRQDMDEQVLLLRKEISDEIREVQTKVDDIKTMLARIEKKVGL